tara:strand:- start:6299 stop:7255 length:957 start_codon:yes stop_codon:yes gene_type:complete
MREIDKKLTAGKSTKNTQDRKGKSFGYQILGFGSGGAGGPVCITYDFFVVGGGGGGVSGYGGGGGGGGVHYSYLAPGTSGITKNTDCGAISVQIGAGGSGNSGPGGGTSPYAAGDGGTSIAFKCEPTAITVKGGGGAETRHKNGRAAPNPLGGSGGGGGCFHHCNSTSGGAGSCYGNPGSGAPNYSGPPTARFRSGSGGGACTAATAGGGGGTGEAGAGKPSDIEGSTKNFGCGGIGSGVCNSLNGRGNGGNSCAATANQGGGGGRSNVGATGVVYLRFPTACKPANIAIAPSCNTIITTGSCTVLKFIVSGCVNFDG